MKLTDRQLAPVYSETDLIHVVLTGDTSQNPAGSSYKAEIGNYNNNIVRDLIININYLPNDYTEQDVCDYINNLPPEERTIAPTDSKWNVIIAVLGS